MKHRLYVEELVCNLGDKQLADNDNANNSPEALAHFEFEYAFASFKTAGIEHIPEVCPYEYREQQCCLIWRHWILRADSCMEHLRNRCNFSMIEEPAFTKL